MMRANSVSLFRNGHGFATLCFALLAQAFDDRGRHHAEVGSLVAGGKPGLPERAWAEKPATCGGLKSVNSLVQPFERGEVEAEGERMRKTGSSTVLGHFFLVASLLASCSPGSVLEPTKARETVDAVAPSLVPAMFTSTALPTETSQAATPTQALVTANPQATAALPAVTPSSAALLPAPQPNQPSAGALFAWNAPVILTWTWVRPLNIDEYFQIQLSKDGTEPKDFGCTAAAVYVVARPPLGYGRYQWRVGVRRGTAEGDQCTPQVDLTPFSEIRMFEWRVPPESPPTTRPYP